MWVLFFSIVHDILFINIVYDSFDSIIYSKKTTLSESSMTLAAIIQVKAAY